MFCEMRLSLTRSTSVIGRFPPGVRHLNTATSKLHRSFLYVPSSSERMLEKSLATNTDVIIYDLEDSVSPSPTDKVNARTRLKTFLSTRRETLSSRHVAVRVNAIHTPFFQEDMAQVVSQPNVRAIVLPKIHSAQDLDYVSDAVRSSRSGPMYSKPLEIIPSIESAKGMFNLGAIAGWQSEHGALPGGNLGALLFAAEDYCADTSIIRTSSRRELLYTRSQIVITARAFGLDSVDMVCIQYKDLQALRDECVDGRQLGFTGKQAIHPTQVDVINSTFVPTAEEIIRAARILREMKTAHQSEKGAIGIEGEMIDAPMIKQAENTIKVAQLAGLTIPEY